MIVNKRSISLNNHGCKALLFILLLALNSHLLSQSYYSTNPTYLSKRTDKDGALANFNHFYPDTSILKAHQFIDRNFLGNLGLSSPDYLLSFKSSALGFRLFNVPLTDYQIKQEQVEYYKTKGPFAELSGIAGSKQLQLFRMTFSNTFKNNLNITLKLNRYTSQGYYVKQQSFTNNFYLSSNYETKNKRFGFNSFVLVNNNKFQENGGITNDTMRQRDLLVTKALIPVKLSSASRDNRELTVNYSNWIRLNKTTDNNISTYLNFGSAYSSLKYKYKDPDSDLNNYYFLYYLDTTQTLDSTHIRKLNSTADLYFQTKNKNLTASLGYENEYAQHWQYNDTGFINHLLNVKLNYNRSFIGSDSSNHKDLLNQASVNYIVSGAFSGNYKFESSHQLLFYRNNKLKE
ncbi:MAG: putative porin, partial [Sphingobacteriaceae bacterium]